MLNEHKWKNKKCALCEAWALPTGLIESCSAFKMLPGNSRDNNMPTALRDIQLGSVGVLRIPTSGCSGQVCLVREVADTQNFPLGQAGSKCSSVLVVTHAKWMSLQTQRPCSKFFA